MFDLSLTKILVLGVLAVIIFGPDRLPKLASQAGRALRDLRRIAENAKADLQDGLGPEFQDFDLEDLNPKRFVRKHLWDEFDATENSSSAAPVEIAPTVLSDSGQAAGNSVSMTKAAAAPLKPVLPTLATGESPPYDAEAT